VAADWGCQRTRLAADHGWARVAADPGGGRLAENSTQSSMAVDHYLVTMEEFPGTLHATQRVHASGCSRNVFTPSY
jgi:hypothetical protein